MEVLEQRSWHCAAYRGDQMPWIRFLLITVVLLESTAKADVEKIIAIQQAQIQLLLEEQKKIKEIVEERDNLRKYMTNLWGKFDKLRYEVQVLRGADPNKVNDTIDQCLVCAPKK